MKYFDVHTHTNMDHLLASADEIAQRCSDLNISYVDIGIDIATSKISIQHAKQHNNVYACVGIHPSDVALLDLKFVFNELEMLLNDAKSNRIVAIGETGLDYHTTGYDKNKQQAFFIEHIKLARKYSLPLMVHVRDAHEDTIKILKQHAKDLKVIIHCYSGNLSQTKEYINLGVWFSIPGVITFKSAHELREVVKMIPIDKLLSETDAPWLTPVPYRGKINSPEYVIYTVNEIANVLSQDENTIAKQLFCNAINVLDLKHSVKSSLL